LYNGKIGIVTDILRIHRIIVAFTKRKVIDGIEQIGLTHTITTQKTIDLRRKR
jgi:hypothetical protein